VRYNHQPYPVKRAIYHLERWYTNHFIRPQLDHLGNHPKILKPWNVQVYGRRITVGDQVHIITASDRKVRLSVWRHEAQEGRIDIGNYCLLCPGVRIDSAEHIEIGDNCMIASGAYVTDADWHDIYDRTLPIGNTGKITLHDNVWIGDQATICKGVSIGCNSIVGAGAVVATDVPEDVIVAGNPARIIRRLEPDQTRRKRQDLLAQHDELEASMDRLNRYLLKDNTLFGWIRSLVRPRDTD